MSTRHEHQAMVEEAETGMGAELEAKPVTEAQEPKVSENYAYWREHGGVWADEYALRKRRQPYFHLQEIMIADYALRTAERRPAGLGNLRVLELGCGPGRHLRNLSRLPGIDVYGYDQSSAMVSGMLRWTGPEWIAEHVTVGMPTGRLPFEDGSFDLVYTSEVLVHVRPEDLEGILSELVRVSRGQVLHIEPSDAAQICRVAHDGCWKHDLVAAYERMGRKAESLPGGYRLQSPTRVAIDPAAVVYTWPAHMLEMYRAFERDMEGTIEGTLSAMEAARAEAERAGQAVHAANESANARLAERVVEVERLSAIVTLEATQGAAARESAARMTERVHELELTLERRERMMSAKAAELATVLAEASALRTRLGEATERISALERSGAAMASEVASLTAEVSSLRAEREADAQVFRARSTELELEVMREKLASGHYRQLRERFLGAVGPLLRP
jgi:SAM-dependent methyltransferase